MEVQNVDGAFKVKVDGGEWISVNASVQPHPERFSLKCDINGVYENYSAVISPENVTLFNEVSPFIHFLYYIIIEFNSL